MSAKKLYSAEAVASYLGACMDGYARFLEAKFAEALVVDATAWQPPEPPEPDVVVDEPDYSKTVTLPGRLDEAVPSAPVEVEDDGK